MHAKLVAPWIRKQLVIARHDRGAAFRLAFEMALGAARRRAALRAELEAMREARS